MSGAIRPAARQRLALVTGARGAVGSALVEALVAHGYRVRTFSRSAVEGQHDSRVERRSGDIGDEQAVAAVMEGIDVVFHLAALLHVVLPAVASESEYERVNVGGTRNVVKAAARAGVARIVYFSTIAVYGPTSQAWADETSALRPDTSYARTKLEGERIVLDSGRGTVLRLAAVYGRGVKGNYQRLVTSLRRRSLVSIRGGSNRRTVVFDRDVASAALLAAVHPAAVGDVFNVTDGTTHTVRDIVDSIREALDVPPPRIELSLAPLAPVTALILRVCRWLRLRPPGSLSALDKFFEDVAVRGGKAQRVLGFRPAVELAAGWREAVGGTRADREG